MVLLCASSASAQPPPLNVATSGDYPPFSLENAEGDVSGFDLAVANRFAEDRGTTLSLDSFDWPDLQTVLRAGEVDIVMSGTTARPERALYSLFSRPYAVTGAVAVIRPEDRQRFTGVAALDQPEVRIAVNTGGHLEQVAKQRFPNARLVLVKENRALPELVRQKAVHAAISESYEARTWGEDLAVLGPFSRDRKVYLLPASKPELRDQLDTWLAARESDGWLNEQRWRWLGRTESWTPVRACNEAILSAIDLRLQLMPFVAAAKKAQDLPLHDPVQEQAVLSRVREQARSARLAPEAVAELFRVQIGLARGVQENAVAAGHSQSPTPEGATLDAIRAAIASASSQLIAELARCRSLLSKPAALRQLANDLRTGITAPGLPPTAAGSLAAALRKVLDVPGSAADRSGSLNRQLRASLNQQLRRSLNRQAPWPQGSLRPASAIAR